MKALMPMNGGINKDVHPLLIDTARGEVLSRQNCRVHSADGGRVGVNVSIPSMVSVNANLPSGTNIFVGYAEDKEREIGVLFNYNSNGNDGIYLFTGNSVINLGVQSGVLNFNPEYLVDAAFMGDWCVFTDGLNPPRKIRVGNGSSRVGSGSLSSVTSDSIQLARKHPVDAPEFVVGSDSSRKINKLIGKTFQFATYFVYNDYTYSVLSPYSKVAVSTSVFSAEDNTYEDNYIGNYLSVSYGLGGTDVQSVVLLAREGNTGSWFKVDEYDKASTETSRTISFYNDRAREFIPIDKALALYSDVPLKAKTVVAVQNRIGLANVTKGYDKTDFNFSVEVEYADVYVSGNSSDLDSTYGVDAGMNMFYVSFNVPDVPVVGTVINVGLSRSYEQYWSSLRYNFMLGYSFSYIVADGDTQIDIKNAIINDINNNAEFISTDLETATALYGTDYLIQGVADYGGYDITLAVVGCYSASGGDAPGVTDGSYKTRAGTRGSQFTVETVPEGVATYKSGSYYNVGGVFYDERSRTSGVLSPQRIYIPSNGERDYADRNKRARIKFTLNSPTVPSWATRFRFAVTESVNFAGVYPFVTGNTAGENAFDDVFIDGKQVIAIRLPENLSYEFAKGDYVQLEKDSGSEITTIVKTIIGTRTLIDVSGTEYSGFWLILPKGEEAVADYLDSVAYIYRPKSEVENLIYYEDFTTYDTSATGFNTTTGYVGEGDAWFVERKFEYFNGSETEPKKVTTTEAVEDFYINVDDGIRAWSRGRVLVEFDTQGQVNLQDFVWSEPYLDNTKINGISFFSAVNRKQLDEKDGQIQRIKLVGDVLKVIQDNKETSMYIGKQQISNADGTLSLVNTNEFIGTVYPMQTEYGTRFPLSVVKNNRDLYYWDNDRGQVIRSSPNGQIPISDYNMKSEFLRIKRDIDDALSVDSRSVVVLGHYDLKNDEFVITFDIRGTAESWVFKEGANVWTERRDYTDSSGNIVDCYGNLDTLTIGLKSGYVWKFESGTTYNVFFGDSKPLSVTGLLNTYPNEEKCLRSLQTDSNRAANVIITSPVTSTRTVGQKTVLYPESFRLREGGYTSAVYSNILRAGGVEDLSLIHSGVDMTGRYFEITFEDDGTTEFQLRLATAGFTVNR
jgi:hypothetical protein